MAKTVEEIEIVGAAQLMEKLWAEHIHPRQKILEKDLDVVKEEIRKKFPRDTRSLDFTELGAIAEFKPNPKYAVTDQAKFNEFLHDLGILRYVANFDIKKLVESNPRYEELIKPFIRKNQYIRLNINKVGKELLQTFRQREVSEDMAMEELVETYMGILPEHNTLEKTIDLYKAEMLQCVELKRYEKLNCTYGSVSIGETKYLDTEGMYETLGPTFFLLNAEVSMSKLEKDFIKFGILQKSDVDKFRTAVQITPSFTVMSKDSYTNQQKEQNRQFQKMSLYI